MVVLRIVRLSILIAGHGQRTTGSGGTGGQMDWRRVESEKSAQARGETPLRIFRREQLVSDKKGPGQQHQGAFSQIEGDQRIMSADDGTDGCLVAGTRRQVEVRPGSGKARQGRATSGRN